MRKDVALIIPSRLGSSRLDEKALKIIGDKTMVEHVYERVAQCGYEHTYVATDSERIAEVVDAAGGKYVMTDPACPCGTDRVWDAYTKLAEQDEIKYVVNIQGDMPFVDPAVIQESVEVLINSEADISTPAVAIDAEIAAKNSTVKIVLNNEGNAMYFSRHPVPYGGNGYLYHVGLYGFTVESLKKFVLSPASDLEKVENIECLRALYHGMKVRVFLANSIPLSVDTKEDLESARSFYYSRG